MSEERFGALTERVEGIQRDMLGMRSDVREANKNINEILLRLSSVSGGWKVLLGVGAVAAAVGGLIVRIVPMFLGHA